MFGFEEFQHPVAVRFVQMSLQEVLIVQPEKGGIAEDAFGLPADESELERIQRGLPDDAVNTVNEVAESFRALMQLGLRLYL